MRPILLGVCSALFFAVTFVLNRRMELAGGSWAWSASLRYLFTLPLLLAIVAGRGRLKPLLAAMRERPGAWLLWGTVGFGLFYAPICFAAAYAPGWLTAGTWQITIISGSLLAPFFGEWVSGPGGQVYIRGKIRCAGCSSPDYSRRSSAAAGGAGAAACPIPGPARHCPGTYRFLRLSARQP